MNLPCLQPTPKGKALGVCLVRHPGQSVGAFVCATCPENPNAVLPKDLESAPAPIVPEAMPLELQELDAIAHEQDPTLLGNRIETWAKGIGADKAAEQFTRWTGIPCGCAWRKKAANFIHQKLRELTR